MKLINTKFTLFQKYIIIGGVNTVFGYSVFAFLLFLGFHYSLSVLIATVLGVLFNFQTYGKLVFRSHSNHLIGRFILVYVLIYFINVLLIALLDFFKIDLYIAGAIVLFPTAYLGYLLNKRLVWKEI
jgi:putative flippase GtrA